MKIYKIPKGTKFENQSIIYSSEIDWYVKETAILFGLTYNGRRFVKIWKNNYSVKPLSERNDYHDWLGDIFEDELFFYREIRNEH